MLLLAAGCKPTERNYQAAYDAAQSHRQAAVADEAALSGGRELSRFEGPSLRRDGDREYYWQGVRVRPEGEGAPEGAQGRYLVAVGKYRMASNPRAQSADLRSEGWKAYMARDAEDGFWTIAGGYDGLDEAVEEAQRFADTHREYPYIGLPGPVVLIQ